VDNVRVLDSYYHKLSSFGLTSVYHNWHPTYAAVFVNLGVVILLHLYFSSKQPLSFLQQTGTLAALLFLSTCIFLFDSLIGIGTYFVLLLLLIKRGKEFNFLNTPYKRLIAVFILVAGVLVLYINPMGNDKIASLKAKALTITDSQAERNLLTIRLAKWSVYYDIFTTKSLLGTTLGDIGDVRKEKYLEKGFNDLALHNYNAHNQYLEILATLGILGFAVFLMLLFYPLVKKEADALYVPFLIICLITFCTESLLLRQQGILFFMFFYSVYTHPGLHRISSGRK
jgi:O-antigen ligase